MAEDNPQAIRAALFSLPEWQGGGLRTSAAPRSEPPQMQDNFLAAMSTATTTSSPSDSLAVREFFELAQRESIAADERRGGSGSQTAICLESGLLNIESGLMNLESGLLELSASGSFEFSSQPSGFGLPGGVCGVNGVGPSSGGVTDAVNQLATKPEPPPIPVPPPPQRQVGGIPRGLVRRGPKSGRATEDRPEPTRPSEFRARGVFSVTGSSLQVRPKSDSIDNSGRYASITSGYERISAPAGKIKVRQD